MSQIGNEKGGLDGIGRLVAGVEGQSGRIGARPGGAAGQEFARMMASAQGRFHEGRDEARNGSQIHGKILHPSQAGQAGQGPASPAGGEAARSGQLRSALDALDQELLRLRQRLTQEGPREPIDGGSTRGTGEAGVTRDTPAPIIETLSALREMLGQDARVPAASVGDPEAMAEDSLAGEVAGLAEALADWRQALEGGAKSRVEGAVEALRDRLVALRATMPGGERATDESSPDELLPGLMGQLQALEQLMARVETVRSSDAPMARMARAGAGSPPWAEWVSRMAGGGQQASGRSAAVSPAPAGSTSASDEADWSGGPVTAALGLAGRELPNVSRGERLTPTHWSALGGLSALSADASSETMMSYAGLSHAAGGSSSLSSGQSGGSIFTGQSATPSPNPQLPVQLGQQVQWMVGKGMSRANIELRPADLGPLKISIETQGDETRIALTATNAVTHGLLEQHLPRLREWLQESGLAHSEVDISLADQGGFGQESANTDGDQSGDRGGLTGKAMASAGTSADSGDAGEWVHGQGVVDLFA
ncbi:MAG: flagellar hook-length control protein FliK [Halothiobacillaceae bacterium]|nr:flagellar hook-length control protein FliK [Halothiobacillaceae bacterium]